MSLLASLWRLVGELVGELVGDVVGVVEHATSPIVREQVDGLPEIK